VSYFLTWFKLPVTLIYLISQNKFQVIYLHCKFKILMIWYYQLFHYLFQIYIFKLKNKFKYLFQKRKDLLFKSFVIYYKDKIIDRLLICIYIYVYYIKIIKPSLIELLMIVFKFYVKYKLEAYVWRFLFFEP